MKKFISAILLISLFYSTALAQSKFTGDGLLSSIQEQVSLTVSPTIPQPGEIISLRVDSYSSNLNKANIVWYENGIEKSRGVGRNTYSTPAPRVGQQLKVDITIYTEEGNTINKAYSITPASVSLVYEANSYTPPFYKGKALFPIQGEARIVAIPNVIINGKAVGRDDLIYKWSVDNKVIQESSGYGKSSIYFQSDILSQGKFISVEVSAQGSDATTEGDLYIAPQNPEVVIYEKNTAFGVIERALSNLTNVLYGTEVELIAYPFFTSTRTLQNPKISFDWTINGTALLPELNNQPFVLFRNEENQEGTARIAVKTKDTQRFLQAGSASTQLMFKAITNSDSDFSF